MDNKEEKKKIEIVPGNGKDLQISPVETHIPISKPKIKEDNDKKIVIPGEKKEEE